MKYLVSEVNYTPHGDFDDTTPCCETSEYPDLESAHRHMKAHLRGEISGPHHGYSYAIEDETGKTVAEEMREVPEPDYDEDEQ